MSASTDREVRIFPDLKELSNAVADTFRSLAGTAVAEGVRFTAALSGGSTPRELYALLAKKPYCDQIAWERVHLFWADERCVPPAHDDSNFKLVQELLLSRVAIPAGNVHRIKGERGAVQAAADYEQELKAYFGNDDLPTFDLVILGVGEDGHTASLFPGGVLDAPDAPCSATRHPATDVPRLTLTLPVINHAQQVVFLVTGADKAAALRAVRSPQSGGGRLPAGEVAPSAAPVAWYLNAAAAGG